jgi:hypothetical protein
MRSVALTLLLASCASARPMMSPSGRQAWFIRCRLAEEACLDKAAEVCPTGYAVVRERQYGKVTHTSDMLGNRSREDFSHGTLMIECRRKGDDDPGMAAARAAAREDARQEAWERDAQRARSGQQVTDSE